MTPAAERPSLCLAVRLPAVIEGYRGEGGGVVRIRGGVREGRSAGNERCVARERLVC
jgi:hypothetical protein